MGFSARVTDFAEKYFLALMAVLSLAVMLLNFHAGDMQGIVPYYDDFARVIRAGFRRPEGSGALPTFPMWGYGWLILLLRSKLLILFLQQALAVVAIAIFVRTVERSVILPRAGIRVLKLMLVLSLPWYALHSVFWPYSIAASLFVISLCLLVREAGEDGFVRRLILSAICFGMLLNFRSDFILFPPVCVAALLWWRWTSGIVLRRAIVWLVLVYAMLIPWSVYTQRAAGHFLLTSTNSGQVFFLGLGLLPHNRWGITPSDGDSVLRRIEATKIPPGETALTYRGNQVIKRETFARIREMPGEYAEKVIFSAWLTARSGFYPGSFYDAPGCEPKCGDVYATEKVEILHGRSPTETALLNPLRTVLQLASTLLSRVFLLLCIAALPVAGVLAWKTGSLLLALSVLAVVYHGAIGSFSYSLPGYTSNVFLFHLINFVVALIWLRGRSQAVTSAA